MGFKYISRTTGFIYRNGKAIGLGLQQDTETVLPPDIDNPPRKVTYYAPDQALLEELYNKGFNNIEKVFEKATENDINIEAGQGEEQKNEEKPVTENGGKERNILKSRSRRPKTSGVRRGGA